MAYDRRRSSGSLPRLNRTAPTIATAGTTTSATPTLTQGIVTGYGVGAGHRSANAWFSATRTALAAPSPAAAPSRDPSPAMTPDWLRAKVRRTRGDAPTAARVARSDRPSAAASPVAIAAAPSVMRP